jgi:RecB family endonuclease NucS
VRLFRERGIDVRETHRDLEAERNGKKAQVDLLVVNDSEVVVVEVKSRLSQRDVEEHLERLALFRELFPRYADASVFGAMAAMVIPEKQGAFAEAEGLFVIGQAGDDAVLLNSSGFVPKAW